MSVHEVANCAVVCTDNNVHRWLVVEAVAIGYISHTQALARMCLRSGVGRTVEGSTRDGRDRQRLQSPTRLKTHITGQFGDNRGLKNVIIGAVWKSKSPQ